MTTNAIESPATLPAAFRYFTTATSPRILAAVTLPAIGYRLWLGDYRWQDLWIVLGIVAAWPFIEWLIHVFILHFRPFELFGRRIDLPVATKHRAHHRDPWRLDLVFIPLHTYWLTIPAHFLLWNAFFDAPQAFTGIAFILSMTLHYEWVHYIVHTRYTPTSWVYRRLWKNHRLHHCKNEHYWMGVTMLTGDHVLGTAADTRAVPTSPTCRTLGLEDTLGA